MTAVSTSFKHTPYHPATLLRQIHTDHLEWTYADLLERLGLPHSKKLEDTARDAGFTIPDELTPEQQNQVLKVMLQGVFGPEAIAKETGLDLTQVKKYCREVGVPFGAGGYGMFPWPGEEPAGQRRKAEDFVRDAGYTLSAPAPAG